MSAMWLGVDFQEEAWFPRGGVASPGGISAVRGRGLPESGRDIPLGVRYGWAWLSGKEAWPPVRPSIWVGVAFREGAWPALRGRSRAALVWGRGGGEETGKDSRRKFRNFARFLRFFLPPERFPKGRKSSRNSPKKIPADPFPFSPSLRFSPSRPLRQRRVIPAAPAAPAHAQGAEKNLARCIPPS